MVFNYCMPAFLEVTGCVLFVSIVLFEILLFLFFHFLRRARCHVVFSLMLLSKHVEK
jgi:hypothetical protein